MRRLPLSCSSKAPFSRVKFGFTLLEVMIAMSIFMMVMTAVYATWTAILRGSKASLQAAANAQRSRVALRTLQEALMTTVNYAGLPPPLNAPPGVVYSPKNYTFQAKSSGDFAALEFTARLPASFPGVGRYGGSILRRVSFAVEPGDNGKNRLVVYQKPILTPPDQEFDAYKLELSPDVSLFAVEFFDDVKKEYSKEWEKTNTVPRLVKVAIGLGRKAGTDAPQDLAISTVAVPATGAGRILAGPTRGGGIAR